MITDIMRVGIDPGVKTGLSTYSVRLKKLISCDTLSIVKAMDIVKKLHETREYPIEVHFEDARLRTWIPKHKGREVLQGVGSVKRDCKIWEEFCEYHKIPYKKIHPKSIKTKLDSTKFKLYTGWEGRTSEHSRDAAMIVYGKLGS